MNQPFFFPIYVKPIILSGGKKVLMSKKDNETLHNTIYDDVFRTIVDKMPKLLIPVINEVFHTAILKMKKLFF